MWSDGMNRFTVSDASIGGLKIVERRQAGDSRGFLSRLFCGTELVGAGWCESIAQINQTFTQKAGTVRGMHFQRPPHAEMKLVTCLRGSVWDVVVDLRVGSPTFLKWHAEELSASNLRALLIPKGCAHGFQTLTDDCELLYLHSTAYVPDAEAGLNAKDPLLAIIWPLPIEDLSARDSQHPMLNAQFTGVKL